ncbi:MAG: type I-E CRISPR-associated protein Cse1/CasA [Acidobacteria bacterium]|nr:type I-E CRISPR-associated protein Cse1/CasA [Acidobacteriota bacterium]
MKGVTPGMAAMLNLISDPWIPVLRRSGCDTIRPDQIAEPDVLRPDWPRPDLNLACYELLIGLVYLAHPPSGSDDRANPPDAATLRAAMNPLAPAFNLLGDGPRFLQDLEPLEGEGNPPDMLFIDSAGESTAKKNADLMVRRGRYWALPLPLAAMALYTLQAFAPSGGAGNRTSMRGGGPMVTLVKPTEEGLWSLVWANVPQGRPLEPDEMEVLPWMRSTETSKSVGKKSRVTVPGSDSLSNPDPEVFFGQPRRLRLVVQDGAVTRVIQKPWGTNYSGWRHPLTPYYRKDAEFLPRHPRPGSFGYRNWRGVIIQSDSGLRPRTLEQYLRELQGARCSLIVAGWAMDNMKPLDFLWSEQPVFPLTEEGERRAEALVEAAKQAGFAVAACVDAGVGDGDAKSGAGQRAREAFFAQTQGPFEEMLASLSAGGPFAPQEWVKMLHRAALPLFDSEVMPGLADLGETRRTEAIAARSKLKAAFEGRPPFGKKIFDPLGLERPPKRRE